MHRVFSSMIATAVVLPQSPVVAQQPRPATMAGRSTVYAPNGVIATSQPLATGAGLAVLQRGGNAVDAAVTAAAVLNLVEPHMTGIGGDLFAMYWSAADGRLFGLNASGRSGSQMTRRTLVARGRTSIRGVEAVTVPGALSGWQELLDRFGSISLSEALQPAIDLAEEGFPVSPIIASQWQNASRALADPEGGKRAAAFADTYLMGGERAPRAGEWFRNPDLARSLRRIAAEGPGVFYGGSLGQEIVDWVQALGGFLTIDDLRNHEPVWVEPMSVSFGEYRLWELPPNGQGIAALEMLKILEPFDLRGMGHNSVDYLHHLVEAKKLAYADLARYVGDPDDMTINPEALIRDAFVDARRSLIDPSHAADRPDPGRAVTSSETIYLSAADAQGNMISFINSVYDYFGSGVVTPGTGFVLQDRGAGFTMQEGLANTVGPRKRPFHTIIPAFVTRDDGNGNQEPWLSFGVMGGSVQPQGHVQILLNLLVFGMDLQEALDAPRFRHLSGLRLALEGPIPTAVREGLAARGHVIVDESLTSFGGAQAVMRLPRGWAAASDPRKDGMAAGH